MTGRTIRIEIPAVGPAARQAGRGGGVRNKLRRVDEKGACLRAGALSGSLYHGPPGAPQSVGRDRRARQAPMIDTAAAGDRHLARGVSVLSPDGLLFGVDVRLSGREGGGRMGGGREAVDLCAVEARHSRRPRASAARGYGGAVCARSFSCDSLRPRVCVSTLWFVIQKSFFNYLSSGCCRESELWKSEKCARIAQ